jgi:hypothetical protein
MLTGRLPWDGPDQKAVFRTVLTTPVPPLGALHPTVEPQRGTLDRFFIEALAKKPEERQLDAAAFFSAFEVALFGRIRHTGPIFSTVLSAELQAPDVEPDPGVTDPALPPLPATLTDGTAFEPLSSTTMPGKLGPVPPGGGRRLHSMFSMSLSTLPPLSPGDEDEAPLLEAPPVVRKSGSTRSPETAAGPDGAAAAGLPSAPARNAPSADGRERGGASTRWVLVIAVCLIVAAALAGYFVGRAPR